jgi:hypothetical protein
MGGLGPGDIWRYGIWDTCERHIRQELPLLKERGMLQPGGLYVSIKRT